MTSPTTHARHSACTRFWHEKLARNDGGPRGRSGCRRSCRPGGDGLRRRHARDAEPLGYRRDHRRRERYRDRDAGRFCAGGRDRRRSGRARRSRGRRPGWLARRARLRPQRGDGILHELAELLPRRTGRRGIRPPGLHRRQHDPRLGGDAAPGPDRVYSRGHITVDQAKAASCISALNSFPCGMQTPAQWGAITSACELVIQGTIPSNSPGCISSFECAPGNYCDSTVSGGLCTPLAMQGQPCNTKISDPSLSLNPLSDEMCSYLSSGHPALFCDLINNAPDAATCQPLLANGASCSNATNMYYDDQACTPPALCGDNLQCGGTATYPYTNFCQFYEARRWRARLTRPTRRLRSRPPARPVRRKRRSRGPSRRESAYFMKSDAGWLQSATPAFVTARKRTCTVDPCARPVMLVLACKVDGSGTRSCRRRCCTPSRTKSGERPPERRASPRGRVASGEQRPVGIRPAGRTVNGVRRGCEDAFGGGAAEDGADCPPGFEYWVQTHGT